MILRSLACVEHSCAALWCLVWATLPLWLESLWAQEDRWTSCRSDWLQTRPNKPSGRPGQEAEGCPRRNLELEYGVTTSHRLVHRAGSWVPNHIIVNQKMNPHGPRCVRWRQTAVNHDCWRIWCLDCTTRICMTCTHLDVVQKKNPFLTVLQQHSCCYTIWTCIRAVSWGQRTAPSCFSSSQLPQGCPAHIH